MCSKPVNKEIIYQPAREIPESRRKVARQQDEDASQSPDNSLQEMEDENPEENGSITLPYDVVAMIFKNLDAKDLCTSAKVCRLWQEVANSELGSRGPMIDLASWADVFQSCHTDKFPRNLTNKPMLGFLFSAEDSLPRDCFAKHFPKNCVSLVIQPYGLVLNNREYETARARVVYGYFPESSEVNIEYILGKNAQVLHLNKDLEILSNGNQPQRLTVINSMVQGAKNRLKGIKCMILMTANDFTHERELAELTGITGNVPALWGGAAQKLIVCKRTSDGNRGWENVLWIAILIGGPNVKSWSIIIKRSERSVKQIRDRLLTLKENVQPMKNTVGFIFTCIGRGSSMHGSKNVESTIFKEIFPHIPLMGAFGNGEFGFDCNDKKVDKSAYHQYSTSFMILTYN
ncbi:F-box only protein 22-like [Diachasmimorpha longicaudata]|uniref:F-box only protein 22-like n=1 Tax=Diachasmimorpha longicaudata TaxID=58733 RepID=UPI0030B8C3FE